MIGVDLRAALNLVGSLVKYLALAPLFPAAVALFESESPRPFVYATGAGVAFGFLLERLTAGRERVGVREGFLVVSLTWLLAAGLGSLPYLFSGEAQFSDPLNAYFEAMSGFTTTGASVVTDLSALPRSLLMWRQFTQWLGGMGIIVLALAVLPRLRVGGRQLMESELPGPEMEALGARIRDTARHLWLLYVGLTALEVLALSGLGWAGVDEKMTPFQALAHAFTTMPTGGFSTQPRSIEAFSAATQWVIVLFMVVAGANFALMYRAFVHRRPFLLARDEEFRLYLAILAAASTVVFVELLTEDLFGVEGAIRQAVFQVVSMMTTTGYASTDFNQWTALAAASLVGVMLIGGSAGSTGGAIKVVRHLLLAKVLRRELDQTLHPEVVARVRLNGRPVDERTLRAILSFVLLYVGIFAVGSLLLMIDAARLDLDVGVFDALAAAATTLGNVGPAFGFAGPMGSFEPYGDLSKLLMIGLMWLGRLEIIPVVVLATRNYWRA